MKAMIRRIRVTDFGPFEGECEFRFDGPGTYAICAPNGAGKSHVVMGAKMTTSPNCSFDKPMGAYINGLGLGAKSAKVEVDYDLDGEELAVTRTLTLKLPEEKELRNMLRRSEMPSAGGRWAARYKGNTLKSGPDVTELLTGLFGIENAVQENAVFVLQDQAGQLLRALPSARSRELQFLSGAEICQKAADIAQRKLSNLHVQDRSQDLLERQEKLRNLRELADGTEATIRDLENVLLTPIEVQQLQSRLQESEAALARAQLWAQVKQRLDQSRREYEGKLAQYAAIEAELTAEKAAVQAAAGVYDAARAYVAAHSANVSLERQRLSMLSELEALEAESKTRAAPLEPDSSREDIASLGRQLQEATTGLQNAREFLCIFEKTGKCPTCGSKPERVGELVQANQELVQALGPQCQQLDAQLRGLQGRWAAYDRLVAAQETWKSGWVKRVEKVSAQLQELGQVPATDAHALEVRTAQVKQHEKAEVDLRLREAALQRLKLEVTKLEAEIQSDTRRCDELSQDAGKILQPDLAKNISESLHTHQASKEAIAGQRGALQAQQQQMTELAAEVEALQDSQAKISRQLKVVEFLESIKSIMHHSAIPHDRSIVYLESINRIMGAYCEILHAPFSLYIDPDTQHFMSLKDGEVSPAYQLSGGQRTLAAWAWHLALYEKHGNQVGFILMDEPTVGLDDANLANIGEAVRYLTRYCHGSGMQFIMVTHEAGLASVFDKVIEIT